MSSRVTKVERINNNKKTSQDIDLIKMSSMNKVKKG